MAVKTRKTGDATGRKVAKKTEGKRQTVKAKPTPPTRGPRGHRGIIAGTRKEACAKVYDQKGRDAAIAHGLKLGLAKTTLQTWTGTWRREDAAGKAKSKRSPKAENQSKAEAEVKEAA